MLSPMMGLIDGDPQSSSRMALALSLLRRFLLSASPLETWELGIHQLHLAYRPSLHPDYFPLPSNHNAITIASSSIPLSGPLVAAQAYLTTGLPWVAPPTRRPQLPINQVSVIQSEQSSLSGILTATIQFCCKGCWLSSHLLCNFCCCFSHTIPGFVLAYYSPVARILIHFLCFPFLFLFLLFFLFLFLSIFSDELQKHNKIKIK